MKVQAFREIYLDDQLVIYVELDSFPDDIKEAWRKPEEPLVELAGRKYYRISRSIDGKIFYSA